MKTNSRLRPLEVAAVRAMAGWVLGATAWASGVEGGVLGAGAVMSRQLGLLGEGEGLLRIWRSIMSSRWSGGWLRRRWEEGRMERKVLEVGSE